LLSHSTHGVFYIAAYPGGAGAGHGLSLKRLEMARRPKRKLNPWRRESVIWDNQTKRPAGLIAKNQVEAT